MRGSIALLLMLAAGSTFAQKGIGAPPDVPKNHWAFQAVDELFKLGLLSGYPDGTFNGTRPASRYELAVGMNNVRKAVKSKLDGLQPQTGSNQANLANLKLQLADLQKQLDALNAEGKDLEALKTAFANLHLHLKDVKLGADELKSQLGKTKT